MEQSRTNVRKPLGARTRAVRRALDESQHEKSASCRKYNSEKANLMDLLAALAALTKIRGQKQKRSSPESKLRQPAPYIGRLDHPTLPVESHEKLLTSRLSRE